MVFVSTLVNLARDLSLGVINVATNGQDKAMIKLTNS